jgi:hypothetical protein
MPQNCTATRKEEEEEEEAGIKLRCEKGDEGQGDEKTNIRGMIRS